MRYGRFQGTGKVSSGQCSMCQGTGNSTMKCGMCQGTGNSTMKCGMCQGTGKMDYGSRQRGSNRLA